MKPLVKITREDNDPMALRISIGGRREFGYYFVYRGEPQQILNMLERVTEAARKELASADAKASDSEEGKDE